MNSALSFAFTLTNTEFTTNGTEINAASSGVVHDQILSTYEPEVNWTTTASLTGLLAAGGTTKFPRLSYWQPVALGTGAGVPPKLEMAQVLAIKCYDT